MKRTIRSLPWVAAAGLCWPALALAAPSTRPLAILRPVLHQYEDGPPLTTGAIFTTGDSVFLSFHVDGYSVSESSQLDLICKVDAADPQGVPIMETGRHELRTTVSDEDKSWQPLVRQSIVLPPLAPPGTYRIIMSVVDQLASREVKSEIQIVVRGHAVEPSDKLVARGVRFTRSENDTQALQPPVYHSGESVWVRFDMVGFKYGEKNRIHVTFDVAVLGPSGKVIYTQPQAALEEGESFYPKRYLPGTFSLNLTAGVRPGAYTIVLTLRDGVGNQTAETKHQFTVE